MQVRLNYNFYPAICQDENLLPRCPECFRWLEWFTWAPGYPRGGYKCKQCGEKFFRLPSLSKVLKNNGNGKEYEKLLQEQAEAV